MREMLRSRRSRGQAKLSLLHTLKRWKPNRVRSIVSCQESESQVQCSTRLNQALTICQNRGQFLFKNPRFLNLYNHLPSGKL